jgi:hypothetical protein
VLASRPGIGPEIRVGGKRPSATDRLRPCRWRARGAAFRRPQAAAAARRPRRERMPRQVATRSGAASAGVRCLRIRPLARAPERAGRGPARACGPRPRAVPRLRRGAPGHIRVNTALCDPPIRAASARAVPRGPARPGRASLMPARHERLKGGPRLASTSESRLPPGRKRQRCLLLEARTHAGFMYCSHCSKPGSFYGCAGRGAGPVPPSGAASAGLPARGPRALRPRAPRRLHPEGIGRPEPEG